MGPADLTPSDRRGSKIEFDVSKPSGPTWGQLERDQLVKVDPPPSPIWKRILKGLWDLVFGSLEHALGAFIFAIAVIALAVYFGIQLTGPQ